MKQKMNQTEARTKATEYQVGINEHTILTHSYSRTASVACSFHSIKIFENYSSHLIWNEKKHFS